MGAGRSPAPRSKYTPAARRLRFVTFDELPPGAESERAALHFSAFHGIFGNRRVQRYRWPGGPSSDYVGLFALEGSTVLGQVFVFRYPYRFPRREEQVAGLAAIATRPDLARRGVARELIQAVLRREAAAGVRHVLLWTNRSWGAHRLYEALGFQDLYAPWVASRRVLRAAALPDGWRVRPARRADLDRLERLHARGGAREVGFVRRPAAWLRGEQRAGEVRLRDLLVLCRGRSVDGYARVSRSRGGVICSELQTASRAGREVLVRAVEALGAGSSCAFTGTAVSRHPGWFQAHGYHIQPSDWHVLMGLEIGRSRSPKGMRHHFGSDRPDFRCQGFDQF